MLDVPGTSPEDIQGSPIIPGILLETQGEAWELSFLRTKGELPASTKNLGHSFGFSFLKVILQSQVTLNPLESTEEQSPKREMSHTHTVLWQ